ncbi:histidyl-tRNA synthetase, partial [mine drainage metagenome]
AVLELMMRKYGCWKKDATEKIVYICNPPNSDRSVLAGIAATVRSLGIACMTDLYSRSLSAQLKDASRNGCAYAVIYGDAEREKESVAVKNMESGRQELVRIDRLEKFLSEATAGS